jgi:hypothetical protein
VDSKAIAVLIIGVSIMVLIVSSVIGAPANEQFHAVSGGSAQVKVLEPSYVPIVLAAAARALPLGGTDFGSRASGDSGCATVSEFKHSAMQLIDHSYCGPTKPDSLPGVWKCQNKVVRDCVGDFPSVGSSPLTLRPLSAG